MKTFVIIGGRRSSRVARESLELLEATFRSQSNDEVRILSTHIDALLFDLSPTGFGCTDTANDLDLTTVDAILVRGPSIRVIGDAAYCVSRFCAAHNIPIINDYSLYYSSNKVSQSVIFFEEGVPFIDTLYQMDSASLTRAAAKKFGYPYILKSSVGSHGDSNYLIKNEAEAQAIIANEPDTAFLAQAFCPNDRDYRLLMVGEESVVIERRGVSGHLNNTSKGAVAEEIPLSDLPAPILRDAERIRQRLALGIAGIDIVPKLGTNEYYFLEVNSQPQLSTGALLSRKGDLIKQLLP